MNSIIFSDEEASYLRAVLKWQEKPSEDENRSSWMLGLHLPDKQSLPLGDFRILVIGAQGVGKTSMLTRFCSGVFPDPQARPSHSQLHGFRRNITIQIGDGRQVESSLYTIDALELPAHHFSSPDRLTQALAITDAAVLVYDITDPSSLAYLKTLANAIHDALRQPTKTTKKTPTTRGNGSPPAASPARTREEHNSPPSRPYHFLLIGSKRDVPASLRKVSCLEGHMAAQEFFGPTGVAGGSSACFMEVSARTGEQVGDIFPLLAREVLKSRQEKTGGPAQGYLSGQGIGGSLCCASDPNDEAEDEGTSGSGIMPGSMRRKWSSLKATLAGSIFRR